MKHVIDPRNKNALHFRSEDEYRLIPEIKNRFPNTKFIITKNKIKDVIDENEQIFLMTNEHNRGTKENYLQLKNKYFWPNLKKNIQTHIAKCEICLKNKYERHPKLQEIGETPMPNSVGEMLHIDTFFIDKHKYLTCIDKFSKFLQIFHININTEIPRLIEQIIVIYSNCSNITTDNDPLFTSQIVNSLLKNYKIIHHTTPVSHSVTNGQVERVHSTVLELARTLAAQQNESITEVIFQAVREYNNSIHSVINQKPSEVFFHSDKYPNIKDLLKKAQDQALKVHNKNRVRKEYQPGDVIYVKTDRRNKIVPRYKEHIVKENNKETITTTKNKKIHKDRIRK